jgi:hypothetical protein
LEIKFSSKGQPRETDQALFDMMHSRRPG